MGDHWIQLKPEKKDDGAIEWTMNYLGGNGNSPSTYPVIKLAPKEGHKLTFKIANPAGLSINFDPSMVPVGTDKIHNAFWIQQNTKPPKAALDGQIKWVKVKPTEMIVKDDNSGSPIVLMYQINFVDTDNPTVKVTPLDPEIRNGGGHNIFPTAAAIALTVTLVIIAALGLRRFARGRPGKPPVINVSGQARRRRMSKSVKVEARTDGGGPIDWEIDGKKAKESKIEFDKGDADVTVEFMLQDKTNRKLRFHPESPIWIHENEAGQCPPAGAKDAQIEVVGCDDKKLTLVNKNAKECILRYQLNFVDDANNGEACDPEFRNGGSH